MTLSLMAVCFLVSLPVVVYGIVDLARVPERLYHFTSYTRRGWIAAILAGYACIGFGGILMTIVWLSSSERADLHEDLVLDARWDHPAFSVGTATRGSRRRERHRRQRWTALAVSVPSVLVIAAATVTRVR